MVQKSHSQPPFGCKNLVNNRISTTCPSTGAGRISYINSTSTKLWNLRWLPFFPFPGPRRLCQNSCRGMVKIRERKPGLNELESMFKNQDNTTSISPFDSKLSWIMPTFCLCDGNFPANLAVWLPGVKKMWIPMSSHHSNLSEKLGLHGTRFLGMDGVMLFGRFRQETLEASKT